MSVEISTIVAGAERLGEGAVWDTEDQRLWWVDITGGLIHCYNPEDKSNQSFAFGEPVGCIARREHGGLVVAAKSGFWFFDPQTGQKRHIIDPEEDQPENRFNDGTVDPAGRFWAGTMKDGGEPKQQGKFYLLDTDLKLTEMDKLFYTTNGLAFSPNGDTIYFSDSNKLTRTIWSCNYDSATGLTGNAKTFLIPARLTEDQTAARLMQKAAIGWLVSAVGRFTAFRQRVSCYLRWMCLLKNPPNQCLVAKTSTYYT